MENNGDNNQNSNMALTGRKVFFLYPHSVLQSDLLDMLIDNEYEVYLVNDHRKMLAAAEKYPGSIIFINIDEAMQVDDWTIYIQGLMTNEKTWGIQVGILTYNNDTELARKFLMELMVPCGFIVLSLGIEKSIPILLKMLEANEARGRRKFIRAATAETENTKFNVNIKNMFYTGKIIDISIAGMAIIFDNSIELEVKAEIKDIQLILRGIICMVSGINAGNRQGDKNCYVILFSQVDDKSRNKIHTYIYKQLQEEMNSFFKNMRPA
jgi:hypothetical protein